MKPEVSEKMLIEELFSRTKEQGKIKNEGEVVLDRLTGDASTRRYYRLSLPNISYVVCLDGPVVDKEYPFVLLYNVFSENNVRVPKIYDHNLPRGYLLEEDLGDTTLLKRLAEADNSNVEFGWYEKAINELIKIQMVDHQKYNHMTFTKMAFDFEKLMSECEFTIKFFINNFLKKTLSAAESNVFYGGLGEICRKISEKNRVVTHRDYHSRNLMVLNDELVVIDFQDARMGIPQYDLVSLLEDCYFSIDSDNKRALIKYYWDNFELVRNDQSYEEFRYLYDLVSIQRIFKAIGSFAYIYCHRNDLRYLKYIGFGMENLRKVLMRVEDLTEFRKTLYRLYYEN